MAEQENTQAVVLLQPNGQKVYLDLNHSTDTTAIWSFVIAMIVALILGISATIIAIWYGRKSFKLTEMSFKVVSEDIKQAAETNRQTTKTLIESQENLKDKELKVLRKQNIEDKFSDVISKYLSSANLFTHTLSNIIFNLKEEEWENFNQKEGVYPAINKLVNSEFENLTKLTIEITLLLNDKNDDAILIMNQMAETNKQVYLVLISLVESKELTLSKIQEIDKSRNQVHEDTLDVMKNSNSFRI